MEDEHIAWRKPVTNNNNVETLGRNRPIATALLFQAYSPYVFVFFIPVIIFAICFPALIYTIIKSRMFLRSRVTRRAPPPPVLTTVRSFVFIAHSSNCAYLRQSGQSCSDHVIKRW